MQPGPLLALANSSAAPSAAARLDREPGLFVLAILLMLSFSLFPRGYMPARTASGFTILLCSAAGLQSRPVDAATQSPKRHVGSERCDLISAAAVLPAAAGWLGAALVPAALSLWSVRAFIVRFQSAFDPNAPPTAPPLRLL